MTDPGDSGSEGKVRNARDLFPATAEMAYFNTAAVGLAGTLTRVG
jgi:hypothetical protein